MSTDTILNVETTLLGFGGDRMLFDKVARIFVRTAPDLLKAIGAAISGNDVKRVYTEAHTLKGSVGVFAAPRVLTCVSEVAQHAKNSDLPAAKTAFAAAEPLVEGLLAELERLGAAAPAQGTP